MKLLIGIVACLAAQPAAKADNLAVREEVNFRNGEVTLSGDLLKPHGTGPFPAFVWCHGSGSANRQWGTDFSAPFVKAGYAFLAWDKPGVGKSGGNAYPHSLTDRANEVVAAADMLMKRSDIDPKHISFCGASQAGYVLPRVIQTFPAAEKLVLIGPGSWSFSEERAYQRQTLPAKKILSMIGLTDQRQCDEFLEMFGKVYDAPDDNFVDEYMVFHRAAMEKPWYQRVRIAIPPPPTKPNELVDFKLLFREAFSFDAIKEYSAIPCPTLVLFGESDECVDFKVGIRNIRAGFKASGNPRLTVITYPKATHSLAGAGNKPQQDILDWLARAAGEN